METGTDEECLSDGDGFTLAFAVDVSREEVSEADVEIPPQRSKTGETVVEEERRVVGDVGEGLGFRAWRER